MIKLLLTLSLSFSLSATSFAQDSVEESKASNPQETNVTEAKPETVKTEERANKEEPSKEKTDEPTLDKKEEPVAKKRKAVFLGHLLTPTTYLPEAKTITAGSHVIGYSVNDNLLVGTSSFLLFFYNSPNIYVKYGRQLSKKQRWSVQLDYLKSDESFTPFNTEYFMEAAMGWLSWSYGVTPFYTFHTSFNYMYFFNEGKPHSLRREPFNDDPFQFTFTTLHDVRVTENFGLASEIGILGINYEVPNLHGAVSFRYTRNSYFVQVGVSFDAHVLRNGFDRRNYILNNPTLDASHTDDFVIHPEVAFQYFF